MAVPDLEAKPLKRVNSIDNRETVFQLGGKKERTTWLNEADVDFFTGGSSGAKDQLNPELQQTVQVKWSCNHDNHVINVKTCCDI